jgi:hypothetical protein
MVDPKAKGYDRNCIDVQNLPVLPYVWNFLLHNDDRFALVYYDN